MTFAKVVLYAVLAYFGYLAFTTFLRWKANQSERDRQVALEVAEDQKQGAKYAMIGGVVAGTAGVVSSILSLGFRK